MPLRVMGQQARDEDGFSLLELVVVVAVLAILAAIGIPMFNFFIKQAAYIAGQWSLASARSTCAVNKSVSIPTGFFGTHFSSSNSSSICDGNMTASFDGGCQISINLKDGGKTSLGTPGWPSSLDACSSQALIAGQSDGDSQSQAGNESDGESDGRRVPEYEVVDYKPITMRRLANCDYFMQLIDVDADYEPSTDQHAFMNLDENGVNPPAIMTYRKGHSGNPSCKSVRIPASHFENGVLPKPFEVKNAQGIFPAKKWDPRFEDSYPEGAFGPQNLFDSEGYPIAIVNPEEDTAWMTEKYPDIDLSTISPGICDPRNNVQALYTDCKQPPS